MTRKAFLGFLSQIVKNRIRDEIRKDRRRPCGSVDLEVIADRRPTPLAHAIGQERIEQYECAVARLSPSDRDAIFARFELGFSHAEVARELELPTADAARAKVRRAIKRLVKEMNK